MLQSGNALFQLCGGRSGRNGPFQIRDTLLQNVDVKRRRFRPLLKGGQALLQCFLHGGIFQGIQALRQRFHNTERQSVHTGFQGIQTRGHSLGGQGLFFQSVQAGFQSGGICPGLRFHNLLQRQEALFKIGGQHRRRGLGLFLFAEGCGHSRTDKFHKAAVQGASFLQQFVERRRRHGRGRRHRFHSCKPGFGRRQIPRIGFRQCPQFTQFLLLLRKAVRDICGHSLGDGRLFVLQQRVQFFVAGQQRGHFLVQSLVGRKLRIVLRLFRTFFFHLFQRLVQRVHPGVRIHVAAGGSLQHDLFVQQLLSGPTQFFRVHFLVLGCFRGNFFR